MKREVLKIEKAGDVATCVYEDADAFYAGDLPADQIDAVFKHSGEYVEKVAKFSATAAEKIMADDKDINTVVISTPYGTRKVGNAKPGAVVTTAKRTITVSAPGKDMPKKTRSDIRVKVHSPQAQVTKSVLKKLQETMTSALLD